MKKEEILLVYDKDCPACDNYCQVVRIRESIGELKIINARESSEVLEEITQLGLDIDQGMVLKMAGVIYYGADAIHALALISSRSGVFNKLNYWLFKSKRASAILYPLLRFFRNLLLKMLGKTKINNLNSAGNDRF
ncbi:DCC1-like thiol-disulfide oxidoreductase family protein [Pseudoalteromonas sp. MTN2-4]|uniref:DCC1-like thiol-disulfide oxidoreductase family protein n=1 Tax=Pseudoalteromonas sp. MTN2-4 TaxID=3056555 RepID=UPI0036F1989B